MVVPHKCHKLRKIFPQEAFRSFMTVAYNLYEYSQKHDIPKELKDLINNKDLQNFTQMMNRLDPLLEDSDDKTNELVQFMVAGLTGYTLNDMCHGTSRKNLSQITHHKFEREFYAKTKRMITNANKSAIHAMLGIKPKKPDDDNNGNIERYDYSKIKSKNSDDKNVDNTLEKNHETNLTPNLQSKSDALHKNITESPTIPVENPLASDVLDAKTLNILNNAGINFLPKGHSRDMSDEFFDKIVAIDETQFDMNTINFNEMQQDFLQKFCKSEQYDFAKKKLQKLYDNRENIQKLEIVPVRKKSTFNRKAYNARLIREARRFMYATFGTKMERKISLKEAKQILRDSKMPEFYFDKNYDDNYEFRNNTIWDKVKQTIKSRLTYVDGENSTSRTVHKRFVCSIISGELTQRMYEDFTKSFLHTINALESKINKLTNTERQIFNQITVLKRKKVDIPHKILYYEDLDKILFANFKDLSTEVTNDNLDHNWDAKDIKRKRREEEILFKKFMGVKRYM